MAAVTSNQLITSKLPGHRVALKVTAATKYYQGTLVFIDASTGLAVIDDASGANRFAGICISYTDSAEGATHVEVYTDGEFELVGSGFTQASVGVLVHAIDNYTIQASATNASQVGIVTEYISSTRVMVDIRPRITYTAP